jgi:protein-tyrosine-phosphatase/predicted ATP-grasp superfamily ATP-dependent carboligase
VVRSIGSPRRKALVLGDPGDEIQSLLSVIRSLGRGGVEIHVGWCPPESDALRSRYVARAHQLPTYDPNDARWKASLIDLMDREAFDLVIPCTDPSLIPLQVHRSELETHGRIYLLSDEAFRIVSDKLEANALVRSLGLRLPRECVVERIEQIDQVLAELRLPVVLKPQWSYDRVSVGERRSVRFVDSREDLGRSLREMLSVGPVAAQEFFVGRGAGVELLLCEGEPLLEFQHLRLHEPPRGGAGSYRQSMSLTPELRDAAVALLGPLRYTGVAMVEFKVNSQTGDWVFIEVNGRFWGSLPLAVAAGADFPLALFQLLVEGRRDFRRDYRVGLRCRNWRSDRWWLTGNLRSRWSDPSLPTVPLWKIGLEALTGVVTLRERSDTFALDDPGPAVAELRLIAQDTWHSLSKRIGRVWLQSVPVRRRLERRARAALRDSRSILFVCLGNICRSPFAEYFARHCLPADRDIRSAGYYPEAGRRCPEQAIAGAATWAIDLRDHRSQRLTDDLVRTAEAVFVFDEENYRSVRADYPSVLPRLHFIGALDRHGPLLIEDPYGSDPSTFDQTYQAIAAALRAGQWSLSAPARRHVDR